MRDLTRLVLDRARARGATYADVRVIRETSEVISVKDGIVAQINSAEEEGLGIRVIASGSWGFSSSPDLSIESALKVAEEAVSVARASALNKKRDVVLAPAPALVASYATPVRTDPFAVSLEDKVNLLLDADRRMRAAEGVRTAASDFAFRREEKVFASTEGAYIDQTIVESGAGISATAAALMDAQTRSYGDHRTGGFEVIEALDLPGNATRTGEEAAALLRAPQIPAGTATIILDGPMLALQVHESVGHPTELDRVLGTEISLAGGSFLTLDKRGTFRYGAPIVNLVADATIPGGLGTFGYDDEGVPAQRAPLVTDGVFRGYQTSRETAPVIGETSNGTMRATGFGMLPLIRMTNINLERGDWSLEEMIRDTKEGYLLSSVGSGSIDDLRINFQFGAQVGWEIRDGALGAMVRNPTYTGKTPEFWAECDAIAGKRPDEWHVWGVNNCGKGDPGQIAHVGHGVAPARFNKVRVGVR
jgi:TldD protein